MIIEAENSQDLQFKVLRTRRADEVTPNLSLSPKSGDDYCPSLETLKQRK